MDPTRLCNAPRWFVDHWVYIVFGGNRADWTLRPDTLEDIEAAYADAHAWGVSPWPTLGADTYAAEDCAAARTFTAACAALGVVAVPGGGDVRVATTTTAPHGPLPAPALPAPALPAPALPAVLHAPARYGVGSKAALTVQELLAMLKVIRAWRSSGPQPLVKLAACLMRRERELQELFRALRLRRAYTQLAEQADPRRRAKKLAAAKANKEEVAVVYNLRETFVITLAIAKPDAPLEEITTCAVVGEDDIVMSFWNSKARTWARVKATSADGVWVALRKTLPQDARVVSCESRHFTWDSQ